MTFASSAATLAAMQFSWRLKSPWPGRVAKTGLAVLVLWALAWALGPGLLKSQLERLAGEQLGRQVRVSAVEFHPWSLELSLRGVEIAAVAGAPQLRLEHLYADVELQSLLRLAPVIDALRIEGLSLRLTHHGDGRYDVDDIVRRFTAAPAKPGGMRFALYNLAVRGASVDFVDEAAGRTHQVRDITLTLPFISNLPALREVQVEPQLAFHFNGADFDSAARATPFALLRKSEVHLRLDHVDVRPYLPYLPKTLAWRPQAGVLAADLQLSFQQVDRPQLKLSGTLDLKQLRVAGPGSNALTVQSMHLALTEAQPLAQSAHLSFLTAEGVRLTGGRETPQSLDKLALAGLHIDGIQRKLTLDRLALAGPTLALERDARRHWSFERWLPRAEESAAASAPVQAPWHLVLKELDLAGGRLRYADRATPRPVTLTLERITLQAGPWSSQGEAPSPFRLAGQVSGRRGPPGQFEIKGALAPRPLSVQGQLTASRLPVHELSPYLRDVLNVAFLRAEASLRGQLNYRHAAGGVAIDVSGDTQLENVTINTLTQAQGGDFPIGQELLNWKSLSLRGLHLVVVPGQATRVSVTETALSDFYARVIIYPDGRINLQDIVKTAAAAPDGAGAPAPRIQIGPMSLLNGRVQFADRFIKPNYSADLSELTGRLGAFSSTAAQEMAELELRGRAEGTAEIEIRGRLNPLAKPLALDIHGRVRDLELPPLSPYSVKYAGHGIERGKLTMDVSYQVQPDGRLQASNRLVLNQLTFGDPVEGAPASLPVRLAVALLADRNGVIDVDLPISGSLNDPEFRLGSVIFKVIVNLVSKAVTAPFSLLASLFSGGDELSTVAFAPGASGLSAERRAALDKIADAMQQRPALALTVAGTASLVAEREAYRRERLAELLQAEKRRAAVVAGKPAQGLEPITPQEQPGLLREVYRRAQIPKPRNFIGLVKDVPAAEMENLLLASIAVGEDQMRQLALARSEAVKGYLLGRGLPEERLFLGAPRFEDAPDPAWTPRAELTLAVAR